MKDLCKLTVTDVVVDEANCWPVISQTLHSDHLFLTDEAFRKIK
jgi:hypothetical protein